MIRHFIFLCSLIIALCTPVHAGYSIFVAPQIPEFVTVNGPYGPETIKNSEQPVIPAGYGKEICRPDNYNLGSTDPQRRSRVFEDANGTAVSADLFAVCPQIKAVKEKEIRSGGGKRLQSLASPYGPEERESWATQQREARSWLADHASPIPMISAMATVRGITIDQMVSKIMENVALFEAASGQILGLQQRLLDQITAEQDFGSLLAITWP